MLSQRLTIGIDRPTSILSRSKCQRRPIVVYASSGSGKSDGARDYLQWATSAGKPLLPTYKRTHQKVCSRSTKSKSESAGIISPKVTQAFFGGLRGGKALEQINAEEPFITLPRAAALVVSPKERCPCPPSFVDSSFWNDAPWFVKMTMLILYEKSRGKSSPVWGYIEQLPTTIDTPVRWTDAEIRELQYKPLEDDIVLQRDQWQKYHQQFVAAAGPDAPKDYESFLWALENVRSRSFSGPYAGAPLNDRLKAAGIIAGLGSAYVVWSHVPLTQALNGAIAALIFNLIYDILLSQKLKWHAMCPVIDTLNHNSLVTSDIEFEYFKDCFTASVSSQAFQPGEQVFISYGVQSNSSLLQYYGFVEDNNPNDIYMFETSIGGGDNSTVKEERIKVTINAKGGFTPETLSAAKNLNLPDVQAALLAAVERELQSKPTSISEDERLLQTSHMMTERTKLATIFRIQKKKLLERCVKKSKKKVEKKSGAAKR